MSDFDENDESGTESTSPDPFNESPDLDEDNEALDNSPEPPASEDEGEEDEAPYEAPENANVKLSSARVAEALGEGITNIGPVSVELPNTAAQVGGFYLPQDKAAVLVAQFPQYKFFVAKGDATPPVNIGA